MSNTAKLKSAAEKARWGDWSAYKPHSGARGYEVRVGSEAVAQHCLKEDAAFIAEASPKAVLCLIAALEAAEKRVAELENDEVRQRLANAEHQLYMAELAKNNLRASRKAQFKKRKAAEKRIAELESRTLRVNMPALRNAEMMSDLAWNSAIDHCLDALIKATDEAGINLETGGEA
ncbi:ead/Ea22-like family protein [Cronobacter turicensis]